MTPKSRPRHRSSAALLALILAGCGGSEAPPPPPPADPAAGSVAYDLAERFPAAGIEREISHLELGTPKARPHLVEGWGRDERDDRRPYVWAMGDEAWVDFFASGAEDVEIVFHCRTFPFEGAPEQEVSVSVGENELGSVVFEADFGHHRIAAPASALVPGRNRLRLEFAYSRVPSEVSPDYDDRRSLAAQCYSIDFEGLGTEAEPSATGEGLLGVLQIPFGTQVVYYLDLGPGHVVELADVLAWGTERARLVVELSTGGEAERIELEVDENGEPLRHAIEDTERRITRLALTPQRVGGEGFLSGLFGGDGEDGVAVVQPVVRWQGVEEEVAEVRSEGEARRPDVLIYLIDTVRADHVGAYGYGRPTTPEIDAFAEDAVLFLDGQAQSSWTRTSVVSLLTGLNPQVHRVNKRDDALPGVVETLAERLGEVGYETAGFITNGNVDATFALDQGFELYEYLPESRQRPEVHQLSDTLNEFAFSWLDEWVSDEREEPFFLYLHATDPHAPYTPPEPYRSRFAPGVDPDLGLIEHVHGISAGREEAPPGTREAWLDLYDAEIAFNDHHFGRLLDKLREIGLYEETLIVLVSDHGEEFLEHGGWEHGKTLYGEQLRVPYIVRLPGGEASGEKVETTARHVDVVPTVLDYLGLPPAEGLDGASLLPLVRSPGEQARSPESYSYLALDERRMEAVLARGWKLIVDESEHTRAGREQLFDVGTDPGETKNLVLERSFEGGFLRQALRNLEWELRRRSGPAKADKAEIDEALRERLEALGYLGE